MKFFEKSKASQSSVILGILLAAMRINVLVVLVIVLAYFVTCYLMNRDNCKRDVEVSRHFANAKQAKSPPPKQRAKKQMQDRKTASAPHQRSQRK